MIEIEMFLLSHPLLFIFIYRDLIKNGGTWNKKIGRDGIHPNAE